MRVTPEQVLDRTTEPGVPAPAPSPTPSTTPSTAPTTTSPTPPTAHRRRGRLSRALVARRGLFVRTHRWLSVLLMLWIVLESATGATIVFAGEIDRAWNRDAFHSTSGDVGVGAATAAARAARPDDLVAFVAAPRADQGQMYRVWMTDVDGDYHDVIVDPGTGTVRDADHQPPLLVHWAEELHYNLNSTSIFGIDPVKVLGWLAVGWLAITLTGFYVWYWPGIRRWARALRVRRRRGPFTFHLDLHKAVAILAILPLTAIIITGINFAFPHEVRSVWNAITLGHYESADTTAVLSHRTAGAAKITAQQAIDAVRHVDPAVHIAYVTGPGGSPVGVWDVEAVVDASLLGAVGGERTVEFAVDQYTGAVVDIDDPADRGFANQAYDDWSYQVHFGTFGGTLTRILWVGVGLAPLVLAATGLRMLVVRRGKRRARRATAPGLADLYPAPAAPAAPAPSPSPLPVPLHQPERN